MSQLADQYRRTQIVSEFEPYQGVDAKWHDLKGYWHRQRRHLRYWRRQADQVQALKDTYQNLTDCELKKQLEVYRQQSRLGKQKEVLIPALAAVCEVASRTIDKSPYPIQVVAAIALTESFVIEMAPGEGKTITAGLAGVLAGWLGKPCHIVTANDYLAARDAELMAPLYNYCNVSVGSVTMADSDPQQRKQRYQLDVIYTTSKELLADYLRDQMRLAGREHPDRRLLSQICGKKSDEDLVMRGLYTAIIDEADSVLADEATTPLIISVPGDNPLLKEASLVACDIVKQLHKFQHYIVNERFRSVEFTIEGKETIERLVQSMPPLWQASSRYQQLLRQALMAKEFNHRDKNYIVVDNEIIIVDEATGRLMPGRSWSYGLHQAIEAKEGLEVSDPSETHARLSFQRFFRYYRNLSGMSGTLQGIENELWRVYKLPVIGIPSRLANQRKMYPQQVYFNVTDKWLAVCRQIQELIPTQRPILVGTRSIEECEALYQQLLGLGIACQRLNACHDEEEAEIIAHAGQKGAITIATNMAGRGTDIVLDKEVIALGGLHVIATERFESSRVDIQLYGRSARQGNAGSAQVIMSLDDPLFRQNCSPFFLKLCSLLLRCGHHLPIARWLLRLLSDRVQNKVEKNISKMRNELLARDFVLLDKLSFLKVSY